MEFFHELSVHLNSLWTYILSMFENVEGFLQAHTYQPGIVYTAVVIFFLMSGFGFPIPEEVTLIGAGLVAYMAQHPELYPPPPGATSKVDPYVLSLVCLLAVLFADYLIFWMGKTFGRRLLINRTFRRLIKPKLIRRVRGIVKRNGLWASGIFRFTPGIRFPGHLICGMMRIPPHKFLMVDGIAALLSVPTQILLIAHFGDEILRSLRTFKVVLFSILGILLLYFLVKWLFKKFLYKPADENPL